MVEVAFTELARQDLLDIEDYISQDSPQNAQNLIRKLTQRVHILKDLPQAGRMVPEMENAEIRELIEGNYRIIYKVISEIRIDILRIIHSRRLLNL
jgi:toxin ParE1/3/4